jgi:hypothetical protein
MTKVASDRTNVAASVPAIDHDLEALIDSCGSSPEALRECVLTYRRSARWALDAQLHRILSGRAHDARDLCARELTASLADISVGELLQTIGMGKKDAIIDVFHGPLKSRMWCSGGEIVDAATGRLKGEAAVYRILALDHGELLVDFRPVQRPRTLQSSTQALMLEALRRKDECAVLEKRLGGPDSVYSSVANAPLPDRAHGLESALLDAFKAGARIETVLASSALDDLAILQAMCALVERGSLVESDSAPTLVARPTPPAKLPPLDALRRWLGDFRRFASWRIAVLVAFGVSVVLLALVLQHPSEDELAPRKSEVPVADRAAPNEKMARDRALQSAQPFAAAVAPSAPREAFPSALDLRDASYPVQVMVDPATAELWLDGTRLSIGELSIVLARNGRTHELRITAPEHRSQTFLFRDNSPPRAVRLQPDDNEGANDERNPTSPAAERRHSRAVPIPRRELSVLALPPGMISRSGNPR